MVISRPPNKSVRLPKGTSPPRLGNTDINGGRGSSALHILLNFIEHRYTNIACYKIRVTKIVRYYTTIFKKKFVQLNIRKKVDILFKQK